MASARRSTVRRKPARKRLAVATLLLAALFATFDGPPISVAAVSILQKPQTPFEANVAASSSTPSSSSSHIAAPSTIPPIYATGALSQIHKPWIVAAKDSILEKVSGFLSSALPDPRYFSWDLDQFSESSDESVLDSGLLGDSSGLNWGGSTLEVVRSQAIFLTRSAAFGPHITANDGLKGSLLPVSTFYRLPEGEQTPSNRAEQACPYKGGPGWRRQEILNSYEDPEDRRLYSGFLTEVEEPEVRLDSKLPAPPKDWIALVERGGGCGFADKVRVAQALGAIAVVVGDAPSPTWHGGHSGDPNEEGDPGLSGKRLITMYAPGDTSDIRIPSTFVTRPSYLDLSRLIVELEKDGQKWQKDHRDTRTLDEERPQTPRGLEIVISKDDLMFEWPLIDLGILLLLLPSFMTVITVVVHRIRMIRQRRKERAPELVVLGLPCLIWRSGGQPWEKIEGPDIDPGPGNGGSGVTGGPDGPAASTEAAGERDVPSPGTSVIPGDLESGTAGETIPLLQEEENEAGPSRRPTSTIKVPAPPSAANRSHSFLPPGRTYFSTDECAICLCDFVDGDRVRVLPCGHIFHRQEIDDWLVRVKKLCPICKRDITVPIPPAPPGPPIHHPSSSSSNGDAPSVVVATNANGSAVDSTAEAHGGVPERQDDTPTMERY